MELMSLLIIIGLFNVVGYTIFGYKYRFIIMFVSIVTVVFFLMYSDILPSLSENNFTITIGTPPDEVNETLIEEPEPEPEPEIPKTLKEIRDKYIENYYSR